MDHQQTQVVGPVYLDRVHDARHCLREAKLARESLVFMLQLPAERVAGFVYTWVNAESKAGSAFCVYGPAVGDNGIFEAVDGIAVPKDQGFDDWRVGGAHVRHGEPFKVADVTFRGERASLEYHFEAAHPPYAYGSHRAGCPSWIADDRIEQSGRVRGVLRLGSREIPFDTMGHRDHSWGTRDWGISQHWKWLEAQAGPDLVVHFFEIQALGRSTLLGYVFRDGRMSEVTAVDVKFEHDGQLRHRKIEAIVRDDAGRETTVRGTTFALYPFKVSPLVTLNEGSMTVEIDGAPGVGHVEMCWPANYLEYVRTVANVA